MEEYAYILDYLPNGQTFKNKDPICYAVGSSEFKLFELMPKPNVQISLDDKVYIGKDLHLRKEIDHVKRRVDYGELTSAAAKELVFVVRGIVEENQERFIKFYNEAGPLTIKKHLLEELPGLGKKTVTEIINARKVSLFKDFEDLRTRVPLLKDPVKSITDRIVLEISARERRHYLFITR